MWGWICEGETFTTEYTEYTEYTEDTEEDRVHEPPHRQGVGFNTFDYGFARVGTDLLRTDIARGCEGMLMRCAEAAKPSALGAPAGNPRPVHSQRRFHGVRGARVDPGNPRPCVCRGKGRLCEHKHESDLFWWPWRCCSDCPTCRRRPLRRRT